MGRLVLHSVIPLLLRDEVPLVELDVLTEFAGQICQAIGAGAGVPVAVEHFDGAEPFAFVCHADGDDEAIGTMLNCFFHGVLGV